MKSITLVISPSEALNIVHGLDLLCKEAKEKLGTPLSGLYAKEVLAYYGELIADISEQKATINTLITES